MSGIGSEGWDKKVLYGMGWYGIGVVWDGWDKDVLDSWYWLGRLE